MKKNILKWSASLFILLFFAGAALADSYSLSIQSSAVANKTDLSIAYLSSVFGTVSGVLTGTSGQMLGKLMLQFNQGMLVVAACWLAFSVLSIAFKSGLTGSFMQQQDGKSAPMIFLRVALGFGLLIPNPSTGYTLLQGIVMQVTVQGVKLADQVWEYGLDYLKAGGALWNRPLQQGGGISDQIMSDDDVMAVMGDSTVQPAVVPDNFDTLGMVQKIMAMEACMIRSSIELSRDSSSQVSDNSGGPAVLSTPSMPLSIYEDLDGYKFEFPGGYATNARNTVCGEVFWDTLPNKSGICTPSSGDNSTCGFSHLALREAINTLLPAVQKYVCSSTENSDESAICSGIDPANKDTSYMADAMMAATINYKNLIDPIVRADALTASNAPNVLDFTTQAKKDGWMVAGRYYWDLLRIEDAYDSLVTNSAYYKNYIPAHYAPPLEKKDGQVIPEALDSASDLMSATQGSSGLIAQAKAYMNQFAGAAGAGQAPFPSTSSSFAGNLGVLAILKAIPFVVSIIIDVFRLILSFSTYTGPIGGLGAEPIKWLHTLGLTCISLGFNIWLGFAAAMIPMLVAANLCSAVNSVGQMSKALIDWLQPLILGGAAGLIAIGFSLGFYMPLYPYMLFTFGVIGWIIAVIEAMVAAPLVALGITHPDGHDFLGRASQAIMLLLGVFLRPVLMLIGLFAAMILCQVSMSIVIYTFSGFSADIFYINKPISGLPVHGDPILQAAGTAMAKVFAEGSGTGLGKLITTILVFPLFLGVFTVMVYTVTVTCFSLIHQLPDYIMAWIGGPQAHGANAQNMVDQVKQGMSSAAHKLGEGVSQSNKARHIKDNNVLNAQNGQQPPAQGGANGAP